MPPSRRALRVLHTADVHLDGERPVLRRIVDRTIADEVDLLLIAGDLFDHARVPDETVAFARAELARVGDFTADMSHVHVIRQVDGETVHLPALDVLRWGRGMEEHEPAFRPLDEIRDSGWDHVALGHQHVQTAVRQGAVTAWYAGAPGGVLRIDFSTDDGIRVEPRPLD